MDKATDILFSLIGIGLVVFFLIIFIVKFIMDIYVPFIAERDYIKTEITRSYGDRRLHWERELKRLYVGSIPVVGEYFAGKIGRRGKK